MKKVMAIGGLALVGLLGIALVAAFLYLPAQAQAPLRSMSRLELGPIGHGFGPGPGRGACGEAGLEAAADVLGMTADELREAFQAGRGIADLAEDAGIELQEVTDAVQAACETAMREAIEAAVESGDLTRDHADWLLEGLDKGFIGGGRGVGFHGFGRGFRNGPSLNDDDA